MAYDQMFSEEECRFLDSYSKLKNRGRPLEITLFTWIDFPTELENGFSFASVDEYLYRLNAREYLERLIDASPDDLGKKLLNIILDADRKFLEQTYPISNPLIAPDSVENKKKYWFLYRVPKVLNPDLKNNLRLGGWLS